MERRQSIRKRAPGNTVYLYYRGKRLHRCKTSDISTRGVFVETDSLAVPLGAVVQLVFIIQQGHLIKTHRKSAVITRVVNHGAGLGFIQSRRRVG
jgi:hypothetical protein